MEKENKKLPSSFYLSLGWFKIKVKNYPLWLVVILIIGIGIGIGLRIWDLSTYFNFIIRLL